jgi:hypothetical protein
MTTHSMCRTLGRLGAILWVMNVPVYLTDPEEMRKARLDQPRPLIDRVHSCASHSNSSTITLDVITERRYYKRR